MSDFSDEELQDLRRLLTERKRKDSLGDLASDDYFDALFDRPHMMAALTTLAPKNGESWTEERLLLWLEVVEKTARLVYGLRSEWSDILGVESPSQRKKADVASDKIEVPPPPELEPEPEPELEVEPEPPPRPAPDDLQGAVLRELAASPKTLSRSELEERLGADGVDVNRAIQSLRADKRVEHCGRGRGTSYRIPARATSNGAKPPAVRVVEMIARAPCGAEAIVAETGISMKDLAAVLNVLVDCGEITWDRGLYAVA